MWFLVVAVMLVACATPGASADESVVSSPETTRSPPASVAASATASRPAAQEPITMAGDGIQNSAPFHLNDGTYLVTWIATPHGDSGCYHGARLGAVDPDVFVSETMGNDSVEGAKPKSGSTYIYNLAAGDYYVGANSGCSWTYTFTQQ